MPKGEGYPPDAVVFAQRTVGAIRPLRCWAKGRLEPHERCVGKKPSRQALPESGEEQARLRAAAQRAGRSNGVSWGAQGARRRKRGRSPRERAEVRRHAVGEPCGSEAKLGDC